MIALEGRFALAPDAVAIRVSELPSAMRRATEATDSDVIWTQTRSRLSSFVVGAEAAALLQAFQSPIGIAEAVVRYGVANSVDPTEVLYDAYPLIREAVDRGLLLQESEWNASRESTALSAGQCFGQWTIVRCVHSLRDGEVYEARDKDGNRVALKVARGRKAIARLQREARVLPHIAERIAPRFVEYRGQDRQRHLAVEWIEGQSPTVIAEQLRGAGEITRPERLRLACGILQTYAALHRQNIVHGDVHPMNIIVDRNGVVRLLDFEFAEVPGQPAPQLRGIVPYYLEPEAAEVALRGAELPGSSFRGEQYALGALLFELFTGQRYLEFHLEPERFLQQVCAEPARKFSTCSVSPWPELEAILQRALAKNPDARFDSVGEFLTVVRRLGERPGAPRRQRTPHRRWLRQRLTDLAAGGSLFRAARTEAPFSSLYSGLAGVASMHLRLAELQGDAGHLAAADCWCAQAEYLTSKRDAYSSAAIRAAAARTPPAAILHGPLGVALTRAAIGHARCDDDEVDRASKWFRRIAASLPPSPDLTLGKAGVLLGAANLLRIPSLSRRECAAVRRIGRQAQDVIGRWTHASGGPGAATWPNLGMAHGWAGILYSMLMWSEADPANRLPAAFPDWLDALGALGERSGKGIRWPWLQADRRRVRSFGYALGWCNGSAGFVALWTLAHQHLKRPEDLRRAEGAAWDASHTDSGMWSLCCGAAGRAFALLTMARATGDQRWLTHARRVADRAIVARQAYAPEKHAHSLFRGDAGLALLYAELEQPDKATFPVVGA